MFLTSVVFVVYLLVGFKCLLWCADVIVAITFPRLCLSDTIWVYVFVLVIKCFICN